MSRSLEKHHHEQARYRRAAPAMKDLPSPRGGHRAAVTLSRLDCCCCGSDRKASTGTHSFDSRTTKRRVRWAVFCLIAAAVLYGYNISSSGYSDYYATAAKSMSTNWNAFFLGAFDPQSTITLDKLSGFLIPQALSARIFGFSAWSLALPQMLEGLVTIIATYYVIQRWIARIGGLIGATIMASTPLLVSMFSHPLEDGMLTMCTTLATAAWQLSHDTDRCRWLLVAGTLVGLGFQAKMMQAWLVLPATGFAYLIVAGHPLAQKLLHLLGAGIVALAVALVAALAGPLVWSLSTLVPAYAGTANDAHAGPAAHAPVNQAVLRRKPTASGWIPIATPITRPQTRPGSSVLQWRTAPVGNMCSPPTPGEAPHLSS